MIKVLFICHGNICRSPMAEYIFKDLVKKNNLTNFFHIESRATSDEEIWNSIGNPIYPNAKRVLEKHNIKYDEHYATKISLNDIKEYDYLICMDKNNIRHLSWMFNTDSNKITLLLKNRDVSDPWYTRDFDTCFNDILLGCTNLLEDISKKYNL